jgi:energy-coupling factor transporter ATP-binding protein EcfA2
MNKKINFILNKTVNILMPSYWAAPGPPEYWEIAFNKGGIWGVVEKKYNLWKNLSTGDYILFWATEPVKGVIGYGIVREKFRDTTPLWPAEIKEGKAIWPYRFKFDIEYCLPREKWEELKIYSEYIRGVVSIGFNKIKREEEARNIIKKLVPSKSLRNKFKELIKVEEATNIGLRHLEALILIHLISGKNVIITGSPGSGKTTLSENICKTLNVESRIITGNPEWTPFDTIGGRDIKGIFRPGLVTNSIIDCWRSLKNKGMPAFLIIDEINRANVDLALGRLFTLLDVKHRENPLIESTEKLSDDFKDVLIKGNLYVPYSFRIIATMNSYDKALLFKLGYALLRRFAVVDMRRNFKFEPNPQGWIEKVKDFIKERKSCDLEKSVNLDMIDKELINLSRREFNDYALIDKDLQTTIGNNGVREVLGRLAKNLGLDSQDILSLIYKIVCTINEKLSNYEIEVTEAPVADTTKFIAVSALLDENWASQHLSTLLDEALSSYVAPQLDILADKVRAENLKLLSAKGESSLGDELKKLSEIMVKNLELIKFSDKLRKLAGGESIL